MSCNSDACDSCETESNGRITLSSQPYDHRYLIMDEEVLLNQVDLLQQDIPPLCDVIILQSVLTEVRKRNLGVFNQLSSLLRNSSKRFTFFANQNFEHTYRLICSILLTLVDRDVDESESDYHLRLVVAASKYFNDHFKVAFVLCCHCSLSIFTPLFSQIIPFCSRSTSKLLTLSALQFLWFFSLPIITSSWWIP